MNAIKQNVIWALRGFRRHPGLSLPIVITLALGIGANATMFGVVDRLLLSPPPHIEHADQVRLVYLQRFRQGGEFDTTPILTYSDYRDLTELPAFGSVAAYSGPYDWTLGAGEDARKVKVLQATASYFSTLGVTPVRGRFFGSEDDALGAPLTAVVSSEYWQRAFGGDPGILGQTLELVNRRYRIVGVTPPGFTGTGLSAIDIWMPLVPSQVAVAGEGWIENRGWWWLRAVTRLSDGVSVEAADAQLASAHRAARRAYEESQGEGEYFAFGEPRLFTGPIVEARGPNRSGTASVSIWLAGVSLVVLLVACANVANLLLARGIRARRERAIRVAMGINLRHLMGQLLTETALLAAAGAAAALLLAHWSSGLVHSILIPDIAFAETRVTTTSILFTGAATLLAALLAGIFPAIQAMRTRPSEILKGGTSGDVRANSRLRGALMIGQTTLSVVLLVGAGLFVRSFYAAGRVDLGFDDDHLIIANLDFRGNTPRLRGSELYSSALERVAGLPGISSVALSSGTLPFRSGQSGGVRIPSVDSVETFVPDDPYVYSGTHGLFSALGVAIGQGRDFEASDAGMGAEPTIAVSETFARNAWPNGDPIGKCVTLGGEDSPGSPPEPCRRVVGVFRSTVQFGLRDERVPAVAYVVEPEGRQSRWTLLARTSGDPEQAIASVRQTLTGVSAEVQFADVRLMKDLVGRQRRSWALGASMFTAFGILALLVAAVGLYSVLAFSVASRRRELGIRSALGARSNDIIGLVIRQASRLVLVGLVLGLLIAACLSPFVDDLLFGVEAMDGWVYASVVLALVVVAGIATALPAYRATAVNPTTAIQAE